MLGFGCLGVGVAVADLISLAGEFRSWWPVIEGRRSASMRNTERERRGQEADGALEIFPYSPVMNVEEEEGQSQDS